VFQGWSSRGSCPSLFLVGAEGCSRGLNLPSLPTPPSPGTRKLGPVPRAASGSLASALFLEALREGDYSFLSSRPSCRKALPGFCPQPLRCCERL
jgi:hypothetical protein